jgi:hypothetical protein
MHGLAGSATFVLTYPDPDGPPVIHMSMDPELFEATAHVWLDGYQQGFDMGTRSALQYTEALRQAGEASDED